MELLEVMKQRHSVRRYTDKVIEKDIRTELERCIEEVNAESGLHIQVIFDEPKCFGSILTTYGMFSGVKNYIALVGKESDTLEENIGYYGEKVVLRAQELGLNTCWVGLTYSKGKCAAKIEKGESLVCVLALGYGKTQGVPHKGKSAGQVCTMQENLPEWFVAGVEAALLAPTAVNQQKFYFEYSDGEVIAKTGKGAYVKVDLGIAKYHFEAVSGHKVRQTL